MHHWTFLLLDYTSPLAAIYIYLSSSLSILSAPVCGGSAGFVAMDG